MPTDNPISTLILNKLTSAQYDSATKNPNELYLITDKTPQVVQNMEQSVSSSTTKYPSSYAVTQYVKNPTITIAKNNVSQGTFTLNQSANKTINIPVPNVINNVTSTSTTDALSAAQGKSLQDQITSLKSRAHFLALWDCTTGKPTTDPASSTYTYTTGDWYLVTKVGDVNYKPEGFVYTPGSTSTTVEFNDVAENDFYIFDGTSWLLQINHDITTSFTNIAGDPYDNTNLASALNSKQDALPSKVGHAEQALYVNASENGYEYKSPFVLILHE